MILPVRRKRWSVTHNSTRDALSLGYAKRVRVLPRHQHVGGVCQQRVVQLLATRKTRMRSDLPQDRMIPLSGQLSVAIQDWEIRLVLLSHEDIGNVDALAALDGQQVRVMLLPPERNDLARPERPLTPP